jgi:hypothetical protein
LIQLLSFAQSTITGKVTSKDNGEALPGVNILVKGTTNGTITGIDGSFPLSAPANGSLIFSFIGFAAQEVPVNNHSHINVSLAADAKTLEEMVVIGYGTMKKSDVAGAITSVKTEELTAIPTTNALRSLQGKVSGLDAGRGANPLV